MIETLPAERNATPSIEFFTVECGSAPVSIHVSHFRGGSDLGEYHFAVCPLEYGSIDAQLDQVLEGYTFALEACGLDTGSAVLRRFHCSDLANQQAALASRLLSSPVNDGDPCAVSWVGQPPAPPAKLVLWAYHVDDPVQGLRKSLDGNTLAVHRGACTHYWSAGLAAPGACDAGEQTRTMLRNYEALLQEHELTVRDHVVRTWFFVRDVDADYGKLVAARRAFFAERGLTPETHFIASTGIAGAGADTTSSVILDAYAISGLRPGQVAYLSAPKHLSPTHIYGVTFERGATIAYRDRKHILISGTASIDARGQIVHPGDVLRQFNRAVENVDALMKSAGATLRDLCALTIYVRDIADLARVAHDARRRFGLVPLQVVVAPVCRPGWLVEIEGMGIVPALEPAFPPF